MYWFVFAAVAGILVAVCNHNGSQLTRRTTVVGGETVVVSKVVAGLALVGDAVVFYKQYGGYWCCW